MPAEDVLLPRQVTGSCYAELTQIYIDIFKVPPTSNLWTSSHVKKKLHTEKDYHLLTQQKSLNIHLTLSLEILADIFTSLKRHL